jgi:hypothetical protein
MKLSQLRLKSDKPQLDHNVNFLDQILADDFQFITPQGLAISKQEDLEQYKSRQLKMTKVDIADQVISIYGHTAVVRFKVRFEGQSGKYSFSTYMYFTRVYSKHSGAWKMVAGHSSEIH